MKLEVTAETQGKNPTGARLGDRGLTLLIHRLCKYCFADAPQRPRAFRRDFVMYPVISRLLSF